MATKTVGPTGRDYGSIGTWESTLIATLTEPEIALCQPENEVSVDQDLRFVSVTSATNLIRIINEDDEFRSLLGSTTSSEIVNTTGSPPFVCFTLNDGEAEHFEVIGMRVAGDSIIEDLRTTIAGDSLFKFYGCNIAQGGTLDPLFKTPKGSIELEQCSLTGSNMDDGFVANSTEGAFLKWINCTFFEDNWPSGTFSDGMTFIRCAFYDDSGTILGTIHADSEDNATSDGSGDFTSRVWTDDYFFQPSQFLHYADGSTLAGLGTGGANIGFNYEDLIGVAESDYVKDRQSVSGGSSGSSFSTASMTLAAGATLIVVVAGKGDSCTGVNWNSSEAMTLIDSEVDNDAYVSVFILENPTITTSTADITMSGSGRATATLTEYENVNTTLAIQAGSVQTGITGNSSNNVSFSSSPADIFGSRILMGSAQVSAGPDTISNAQLIIEAAQTGGGSDTRVGLVSYWPYRKVGNQTVTTSWSSTDNGAVVKFLLQREEEVIPTIECPFIAATGTIYDLTLAAQAEQTVTIPFIAGNEVVYSPTLAKQAEQTLTMAYVIPTGVIYNHSLEIVKEIIIPFVSSTGVIYTLTVVAQAEQTITMPFVGPNEIVYAPTLTIQTEGEITLPFVAPIGVVYAHTLFRDADGVITVPLIAATGAIYTHTIAAQAEGSIVMAYVAPAGIIYTHVIAAQNEGQITVPFVASTGVVYDLTLTTQAEQTITIPYLASNEIIYDLTLEIDSADQTIFIPYIAPTGVVYNLTVDFQAELSITLPFEVSNEVVYGPTLDLQPDLEITLSYVDPTGVIYNHTLGLDQTLFMDYIVPTGVIYTLTIEIADGQTIQIPYIPATGTIYNPSLALQVSGEIDLPYIIESVIYNMTLSLQADGEITVPFIAATGVIYQPTLTLQPDQAIALPFIPSGEAVYEPVISLQVDGVIEMAYVPPSGVIYQHVITSIALELTIPYIVPTGVIYDLTVEFPIPLELTLDYVPPTGVVYAPTLTLQEAIGFELPYVVPTGHIYQPIIGEIATLDGLEFIPYADEIPQEVFDLSPALHEYLEDQTRVMREQHMKFSVGSSTLTYEHLLFPYTEESYTIGSEGRFEHPVYGIMRAVFVKFGEMLDAPSGGPVGFLKDEETPTFTVTNDISLSSAFLCAGFTAALSPPEEGKFGWVITKGPNLHQVSLDAGITSSAGDEFVWVGLNTLSNFAGGIAIGKQIDSEDRTLTLDQADILIGISSSTGTSGLQESLGRIEILEIDLDDAEARITTVETVIVDDGVAQAEVIATLEASIADNTALIQTESQVRVDADSAIITEIRRVEVSIDGVVKVRTDQLSIAFANDLTATYEYIDSTKVQQQSQIDSLQELSAQSLNSIDSIATGLESSVSQVIGVQASLTNSLIGGLGFELEHEPWTDYLINALGEGTPESLAVTNNGEFETTVADGSIWSIISDSSIYSRHAWPATVGDSYRLTVSMRKVIEASNTGFYLRLRQYDADYNFLSYFSFASNEKPTVASGINIFSGEATIVDVDTRYVRAQLIVNWSGASSDETHLLSIQVENITAVTEAVAAATITLQAGIDTNEGNITTNASAITAVELRVDDTESDIIVNASAITTLDGTVTTQGNSITTNASAITTVEGRMTDAEGDIIANAGVIVTQGISITATEGDVVSIEAYYGVKVNANDVVVGFELIADGTGLSVFKIQADKFVISDSTGTDDGVPFEIVGGVTYIKAANIQDGSITNLKIGNTIESDTWNPTTKAGWLIDKTGSIQANAITIYDASGNVILSSGTVPADVLNVSQSWANISGTGIPDDYANNTGLGNHGGSLIVNSNMTLVANDGRPLGWKASRTTDPGVVSYLDAAKTILKVYSATTNSIAASSPAFSVNDKTTYTLKLRLKADIASAAGLYLRIDEYNLELPQGITYIGKTSGESDMVIRTGSVLFEGGSALTTSWVEYEYTYTPTAGVLWGSLAVINNGGIGVIELHVDMAVLSSNSDVTSSNTAAGIAGQGDFATLDQITAANATTFISGAAIGTAQIVLLSVKSAQIDNLTVGTIKITDNAVTDTVAAYTESFVTVNSGTGTWITLQSVVIDLTDIETVTMIFTGGFSNVLSTDQKVRFGFFRDTSLRNGSGFETSAIDSDTNYQPVSVAYTEDVSGQSGSKTYYIKARETVNGNGAVVAYRNLIVIGFKK